ncbi:hypothetical protein FXO37_24563 [Capsicum annuum]|nr:hypothetical protein FXO37_24563 [Capsicum annuum]
MCSQFNSSPLSSSLMVLPKCNFLSPRPILHFQNGCQNSPLQDTQEAQLAQNQEAHFQQDTQQQQQQGNNNNEEEELSEDNVKDNSTKSIPITPECVSTTRQMMICPPAPKKKKAIQVTKRKLVFLDVYDEVESMFPPVLLADLGNKIKKARETSPIL